MTFRAPQARKKKRGRGSGITVSPTRKLSDAEVKVDLAAARREQAAVVEREVVREILTDRRSREDY